MIRPLSSKLWNSPVVWSWGFSGLRLSFGILLLPLLLRLPEADFGFYYVLLSLAALVPLLDLGFLTSIDRAISYAMSGAMELKAHGMNPHEGKTGGPNFPLLWQLLQATRSLYRLLSLGVLVILGSWGTYVVSLRADETSDPSLTWLAWILTLVGGVFEMYSGWWNVYLRGLNRVLSCSRILVISFALKFVVASALLLVGGGLLSVPIAGFLSSLVQRQLSRRHSLRFLSGHPCPPVSRAEVRNLIRVLWPNSWRIGCHYLSGYLTTNFNMFLCLKFLGLAANAEYGLSLQIVSICTAMSAVWVQVKWPLAYQLRASNNCQALQRLLQPRLWLMLSTFAILSASALTAGRPALHWLSSLSWVSESKDLLPDIWLLILFVNGFLEMHLTFWNMLIIAENRLPFLWPTVATNLACLTVTLGLLHFTSLGVGALILAPLVAGCTFNYWFWPVFGSRRIQSSLMRFLLVRID